MMENCLSINVLSCVTAYHVNSVKMRMEKLPFHFISPAH